MIVYRIGHGACESCFDEDMKVKVLLKEWKEGNWQD
jgi:hypothetical protein